MSVADQVRQILVKQLEIDAAEVTLEASIEDDLGADSIDAIELLLAFEDEFRIEIPDRDASDIRTVQDVVAYLERRLARAASAAPMTG